MDRACSTGEKRNAYRNSVGQPDVDQDVDGRIILKWILEK
jgi:hypothetical protein